MPEFDLTWYETATMSATIEADSVEDAERMFADGDCDIWDGADVVDTSIDNDSLEVSPVVVIHYKPTPKPKPVKLRLTKEYM